MKTVTVKLNSADKVKRFVNIISGFSNNVDLVSGRYTIDAKSIMGVFSLDISKPVLCNIHGTEDDANAVSAAINEFVA